MNTTYLRVHMISDIMEMDEYKNSTWKTLEYAILSRRWITVDGQDEIKFSDGKPSKSDPRSVGFDLRNPEAKTAASARKIIDACRMAKSHGYKWLWLDTVCIKKSDSSETALAINSMFKWYQEAEVCYAYLQDVEWTGLYAARPDMFNQDSASGVKSRWFTRGWTLQELLAPKSMEFYDKEWRPMGTRSDLSNFLAEPAGVDKQYLNDPAAVRQACVAMKMSWMAGRNTTKVEDIAYGLLGLLDVNMQPVYGEGIRAFARLQDTILAKETFDESIFAWTLPPDRVLGCYGRDWYGKDCHGKSVLKAKREWEWPKHNENCGLLAPSPDCFSGDSRDIVVWNDKVVKRLDGGFKRTNQGVCLALPLRETKNFIGLDKKELSLPLNCWSTITRKRVVLKLQPNQTDKTIWKRVECGSLVSGNAKIGSNRVACINQQLTSVITVGQPPLPDEPAVVELTS